MKNMTEREEKFMKLGDAKAWQWFNWTFLVVNTFFALTEKSISSAGLAIAFVFFIMLKDKHIKQLETDLGLNQ